MPKPKDDESEKDYMSRCMAYGDMQKYDSSQRAAICHSMYRKAKKSMILDKLDLCIKSLMRNKND